MGKITEADDRLVKQNQILVMRSATVGRSIVTYSAHERSVISDHFLRVTPRDPKMNGWIYAYLKSPQCSAMLKGSQYASIIRHIEPKHLQRIPFVDPSDDVVAYFDRKLSKIIACRNKSAALRDEAESLLSKAVGSLRSVDKEIGFSVPVGSLKFNRRRFEASYHSPEVSKIIASFEKYDRLGAVVEKIWWPNRFKRYYGEGGTPYMSADDVFTTNPYDLKSVLVENKKDKEDFQGMPGTIVMARSGQTYGLNGSAALVTSFHAGYFLSDDLLRIIPKSDNARAGYILTALTHPILGRPLLIREAYGMSIPHLDPGDVANFPLVRLGSELENKIADLAEASALEHANAQIIELEVAEEAGQIVSSFLVHDDSTVEDAIDEALANDRLVQIHKDDSSVIRGTALDDRMKMWEA
ncbi:hypothetical protein MKK64_13720 [Methylobacterium sp. E-025]|uniref:hypothetical protein n=1 Tax=Methylobacterium sp. E-025 TaxID=2836561 RepID=UPI001FB8969F|nr:hypothetical protein [Methylobacterium sp. E-025]MCJ2112242.1 hypothetical protein [Methylobacterium sp. E-025]